MSLVGPKNNARRRFSVPPLVAQWVVIRRTNGNNLRISYRDFRSLVFLSKKISYFVL